MQPLPLKIEPATGLVAGVRQVLSPHFDARPGGVLPELIIVHGISLPAGEFGGPWIDRLFTGGLPPNAHPSFPEVSRLRVSAHALIRRDGAIVQYVPFGQRAWHAGQSHYRGRPACNDFSIGIELEGTDTVPYADPQYEQLGALVEALLATYPSLSSADPGPSFDWERWRSILRTHGRGERRKR
jgi:AmpD protein